MRPHFRRGMGVATTEGFQQLLGLSLELIKIGLVAQRARGQAFAGPLLCLRRTEMRRQSSKPGVKARVFRALEVAVVSLAFAAPSIAQDAPAAAPLRGRPEVHAYRVANPPVIDGALDDEAWAHPPMETTEWLSYNPL